MDQSPQDSRIRGDECILALEVRSSKLGYAVLEGGSRLIDWGVKTYESNKRGSPLIADTRIAELLNLSHPAVVVIRRRWAKEPSGEEYRTVVTIREAVIAEVERRHVPIQFVAPGTVYDFFGARGKTTKYGIALLVADWFQELAWKVPARRKAWDSERSRALIFDALATAIVYLASSG